MNSKLRYQSVINSDGTVAIHEALLDSEGNIQSATYEPVVLCAANFGELSVLLRTIYQHMQKYKPITDEELEAYIYGTSSDDEELDLDESNVIDLVDYLARQ